MEIVIKILTVLAAVSLPVMYLIEWKYGFGKRARLIHCICAVFGIVSVVAVCLLFNWKVASAEDGIRGWATDFFFSYFYPALITTIIITVLLGLAAAVRHPMRRIRMSIAMLLPVVVIATAVFWAVLASDGYFAVDLYIRALAPGLALLPHVVPLCEREKKSH